MEKHYVYKCFDASGRCLYVGKSKDLESRLLMHQWSTVWFADVARIVATAYGSHVAGLIAECAEIYLNAPVHNSVTATGHAKSTPADMTPIETIEIDVTGLKARRKKKASDQAPRIWVKCPDCNWRSIRNVEGGLGLCNRCLPKHVGCVPTGASPSGSAGFKYFLGTEQPFN